MSEVVRVKWSRVDLNECVVRCKYTAHEIFDVSVCNTAAGRRKGLRGLGDGGKGEKGGGRNFMQRIHPRDADLRGRVTQGKERAGYDLNPGPAQASSAAAGRRIEIGLDCRRGQAMGEELWWQG